ncbi:MAG: hypothetical protein INR71_00775, partial [Terriglobus roseus]|nr:hypothetical protein [Terriglobus roseus]
MTVIQTLQAARQATPAQGKSKAEPAIEFARQSAKLAARDPEQDAKHSVSTQAVEARFITGQDPVIQTADGGRLPAVPLEEALKLNKLKDILEDRDPKETIPVKAGTREAKDGTVHGARPSLIAGAAHGGQSTEPGAPLRQALPPSKTNPLFPPLPMYGPPTLLRELQCWTFRISSWFLSLAFLGVIVLGSLFTCLPGALGILFAFATFRDPDKKRKFYAEEQRRTKERREREQQWETEARSHKASARSSTSEEGVPAAHAQAAADANGRIKETFTPTEGGPDPLVCDVGYYAREQGLDCETFHVQTEDGFIIELWHLYNPLNTSPTPPSEREPHEPDLFPSHVTERAREEGDGYGQPYPRGEKKYPVLLLHGLLQSSGAYCCTGESSLAFYLAKCGYDVWLGNNRCGFHPRHDILGYSDPRMWAWNIRQMGVMDLPALVSRVLTET